MVGFGFLFLLFSDTSNRLFYTDLHLTVLNGVDSMIKHLWVFFLLRAFFLSISLSENVLFQFSSCKCTTTVALSRNFDENTSQPATTIYKLEVVFDPKSAFNYHFSYTGKKTQDFIISRIQQTWEDGDILRLVLLIIASLLPYIIAGILQYLFIQNLSGHLAFSSIGSFFSNIWFARLLELCFLIIAKIWLLNTVRFSFL